MATCQPNGCQAAADLIASHKVDTIIASRPDCTSSVEGQPPVSVTRTRRWRIFCCQAVYTHQRRRRKWQKSALGDGHRLVRCWYRYGRCRLPRPFGHRLPVYAIPAFLKQLPAAVDRRCGAAAADGAAAGEISRLAVWMLLKEACENMLDDISDIAQFYDGDPDGEHGRLDQHQLEYDLTWRYLEQYLPPQGTILEVGAATGRYTLALARRGYAVTAVDLSAALIERCRQNLAAAGCAQRVQFFVADARNLAAVPERHFDAVLLMGPLYHLIEAVDRKLALQEAIDRVRGGGVICSAFLNRFGMLADLIKRRPQWIEDQAHVRSFLAHGRRPDGYPRRGFRGYAATPAEIAPLHEALGLQTLILAAVEPTIAADDESYNRLQGEQRRLWLDLLFQISAQTATLGASRHLLYIGKKHNA